MNIKIVKPQTDNGKSKVTLFDVDGMIIEKKYNYGNGYGFLFLTKYNTLENYEKKLSTNSQELIYSSTNNNDCTEEGRKIEFAISKLF